MSGIWQIKNVSKLVKFNIFHQINDIMEKIQTRNILDKREVQMFIKSQKYTLLSQKTNLFSRILII